MTVEAELYYLKLPSTPRPVSLPVEILAVQEFLQDEPACRALWDLISSQFHTRAKFLAVWSAVRFVALHRDGADVDGLLLVSAPVNWQIDYVVVRPEARRGGIAAALVQATLNRAFERNVPYVMLTSRAGLRPLYEGECGFRVVGERLDEPRPTITGPAHKEG